MKSYQLTYLISPEISQEELRSLFEKINSLIEKDGFLNEAKLGEKKELAYPIKKNKTAYLANLNFQLLPEKLANLEKQLKEEKKILRYLITTEKLPKREAIPIKREKLIKPKIKKVELAEIEKKLEEILGE